MHPLMIYDKGQIYDKVGYNYVNVTATYQLTSANLKVPM